MVVPDNGCSIQEHALVAQRAGAAGALVVTLSTHLFDTNIQTSTRDLNIPVLFIELDDFNKYLVKHLSGIVIMKAEAGVVSFFFFIKKIKIQKSRHHTVY